MSKFNLNTTSSDIVCNIMKYIDIQELKSVSMTCKNLKNDCKTFSKKIKKCELHELIENHTCRFCHNTGYDITSNICTECYLHTCNNCFITRNCIEELISVPVNENDLCYGYMKICNDYCLFKCHKCKTCDDRHELFLNDYINFKTICIDCFSMLNDDEKKIYNIPKNTQINEQFDYEYDY